MTADSIDYNAGAWAETFQEWFASYTRTPAFSVKITQRPATGIYKLQFDVQHTSRELEYSHFHEALRLEFSPLARAISADGTKLSFGVLPMPPDAVPLLQKKMAEGHKLLQQSAESAKTKRTAYLFLFFFALNAALGALLLHNHWHFYDEPWHGVWEFFKYHADLYLSSSTATTAILDDDNIGGINDEH